MLAAFWERLPEAQYTMTGVDLGPISWAALVSRSSQEKGVPGALTQLGESTLVVISPGERTSTTTVLGFLNAWITSS